jgi:hypothetical protein
MIRQYLSNKNKNATVSKSKIFWKLNKALIKKANTVSVDRCREFTYNGSTSRKLEDTCRIVDVWTRGPNINYIL